MEFWTPSQLAEEVGVSDRQIRYYIAEGKIKAQKAGITWVISDDEAQKFIKSRQENPVMEEQQD